MIEDIDNKWNEFENIGEKEVIQRIANNVWNPSMTAAAKAWLVYKSNSRKESSQAEQISIQRDAAASASDAARSARAALSLSIEHNQTARTAKTAAVVAAIGAIIAAICAICSIWNSINK
jgi:hypothetical protein